MGGVAGTYGFDSLGNLAWDQEGSGTGGFTGFAYDAAGRLTAMKDYLGNTLMVYTWARWPGWPGQLSRVLR